MIRRSNRPNASPQPGDGTLEQAVKSSVILTRLQDMLAWSRKHSLWPFSFGLSCCYVEMVTSHHQPV